MDTWACAIEKETTRTPPARIKLPTIFIWRSLEPAITAEFFFGVGPHLPSQRWFPNIRFSQASPSYHVLGFPVDEEKMSGNGKSGCFRQALKQANFDPGCVKTPTPSPKLQHSNQGRG